MSAPDHTDEILVLSRRELDLLRYQAHLVPDERSPLGPLVAPSTDAQHLLALLASRGLVNRMDLRPHREVLRRLLILSQPDRQLRLEERCPDATRLTFELYERAGAGVRLRFERDRIEIGPPETPADLGRELMRRLKPRRSGGDFLRVALSETELTALRTLAAGSNARDFGAEPSSTLPTVLTTADLRRTRTDSEPTERHQLEPANPRAATVATTQILRSEPALPGGDGLVEKDLALASGGRLGLRPFARDLAIGLAQGPVIALSRTDFRPKAEMPTSLLLLGVPGSAFVLEPLNLGGWMIHELDLPRLELLLRNLLQPLPLTP